jgi:hypothetical protein
MHSLLRLGAAIDEQIKAGRSFHISISSPHSPANNSTFGNDNWHDYQMWALVMAAKDHDRDMEFCVVIRRFENELSPIKFANGKGFLPMKTMVCAFLDHDNIYELPVKASEDDIRVGDFKAVFPTPVLEKALDHV